jgi:hypothetical protein
VARKIEPETDSGRGGERALYGTGAIVLFCAAMIASDDATLDAEARVFGRYLVGSSPGPELLARYRDASRILWPASASPRDAARLAFVRRHPWSVGPLDAAAALLDPGSVLRSKILLTGAILETTTTHADEFLPRTVPVPALLWRLAVSGAVAVAQAIAGVALWRIAGRAGA